MDKKETPSSLFVNDGSFMERFKQLQQEKDKDKVKEKDKCPIDMSKPKVVISGAQKLSVAKTTVEFKSKTPQTSSGGKLAFSLKQKSKIVVPAVKLGADEDEEDESESGNALDNAPVKRQKLDQPGSTFLQSTRRGDVAAPPPPGDPTVKKVADKLASFVAKNGRQFEDVTRQKNPGDSPFKFLFDESCADFKYYAYRLAEEEKALSQERDVQITPSGDSSGEDPIAMMEFYMKKAAQEERRRQPKQSKDEMPPPASLQGGGPPAKGHHMGDYIPQEELEKFLATCNDAAARKAAKESAERARIQSDNVGHKLLSKMGWKEGEGLGSSRRGIADPIMAGDVKKDHLGVGAHQPGEVTPDDDIYEQYKKRMMLGYKHRPNPLNNPRKSYY